MDRTLLVADCRHKGFLLGKTLFFPKFSLLSLHCFVLLEYFLCVIGSTWKSRWESISVFSVCCAVSVLLAPHCSVCIAAVSAFNHCSHKSSYAMTIDFLWIAGANQFIRKVNRNHWINWTLATLGKIVVFTPNILVMRNWNVLLVFFLFMCYQQRCLSSAM